MSVWYPQKSTLGMERARRGLAFQRTSSIAMANDERRVGNPSPEAFASRFGDAQRPRSKSLVCVCLSPANTHHHAVTVMLNPRIFRASALPLKTAGMDCVTAGERIVGGEWARRLNGLQTAAQVSSDVQVAGNL